MDPLCPRTFPRLVNAAFDVNTLLFMGFADWLGQLLAKLAPDVIALPPPSDTRFVDEDPQRSTAGAVVLFQLVVVFTELGCPPFPSPDVLLRSLAAPQV